MGHSRRRPRGGRRSRCLHPVRSAYGRHFVAKEVCLMRHETRRRLVEQEGGRVLPWCVQDGAVGRRRWRPARGAGRRAPRRRSSASGCRRATRRRSIGRRRRSRAGGTRSPRPSRCRPSRWMPGLHREAPGRNSVVGSADRFGEVGELIERGGQLQAAFGERSRPVPDQALDVGGQPDGRWLVVDRDEIDELRWGTGAGWLPRRRPAMAEGHHVRRGRRAALAGAAAPRPVDRRWRDGPRAVR